MIIWLTIWLKTNNLTSKGFEQDNLDLELPNIGIMEKWMVKLPLHTSYKEREGSIQLINKDGMFQKSLVQHKPGILHKMYLDTSTEKARSFIAYGKHEGSRYVRIYSMTIMFWYQSHLWKDYLMRKRINSKWISFKACSILPDTVEVLKS